MICAVVVALRRDPDTKRRKLLDQFSSWADQNHVELPEEPEPPPRVRKARGGAARGKWGSGGALLASHFHPDDAYTHEEPNR